MNLKDRVFRYFFDLNEIDRFEKLQDGIYLTDSDKMDASIDSDELIEESIRSILSADFPNVPVDDNNLVDSGYLDSLMLMTLAAKLTEAFGIEVSYKQISAGNFNSVSNMAQMLLRLTRNAEELSEVDGGFSEKLEKESILCIPMSEADKPVVQRILESAIKEPETEALVIGSRVVSYGEFSRFIRTYYQVFLRLGVKPGDKVLLQAICSEMYLACVFALHLCCGIVVPVEKNVGMERILEIASDTQSRLILTEHELKMRAVYDSCMWKEYDEIRQLALGMSYDDELKYPDLDMDALILFTTGSTGKSKGSVITHGSWAFVSVALPRRHNQRKHCRTLTSFPLNHLSGLYCAAYTLSNLATLLLVDGMTDIEKVYCCYEKYRPTKLALPPMACRLLIETDFERLKTRGKYVDTVAFGSEPMPGTVLTALREAFPNAELLNTYACTEAGYISSGLCNNTSEIVPLGFPFEGIEIALKDETGAFTEEKGKIGRICVKSKMGMRCYYGESELTASVFENGWFLMSDMGCLGDDGQLYFHGRADDVISIGGYKISPLETEEAALNSKMLKECICIKGTDSLGIPFLRLLVVPIEDAGFEADLLRKQLVLALEAYRVPRTIEIVASIHRNKNGKIDRKYYREISEK